MFAYCLPPLCRHAVTQDWRACLLPPSLVSPCSVTELDSIFIASLLVATMQCHRTGQHPYCLPPWCHHAVPQDWTASLLPPSWLLPCSVTGLDNILIASLLGATMQCHRTGQWLLPPSNRSESVGTLIIIIVTFHFTNTKFTFHSKGKRCTISPYIALYSWTQNSENDLFYIRLHFTSL